MYVREVKNVAIRLDSRLRKLKIFKVFLNNLLLLCRWFLVLKSCLSIQTYISHFQSSG